MSQNSFNCPTKSAPQRCSLRHKKLSQTTNNGRNGLPTRHNPAEAAGDFAKRARQELESSTDPITVGIAGRILGMYGLMMGGMFAGTFKVDAVPLAESFLAKAQTLDPANPFWPKSLEEFRKL